MDKPQPFRLVRDALGFYSQVPIEVPVVDVVHEAIVPVCELVVEKPRKLGRPPKKTVINAEFLDSIEEHV